MKENGVSAGEMQAKLLQKVEELTLFVIEKDKEITEQRRINMEQLKINQAHEIALLELKREIEKLKKNIN